MRPGSAAAAAALFPHDQADHMETTHTEEERMKLESQAEIEIRMQTLMASIAEVGRCRLTLVFTSTEYTFLACMTYCPVTPCDAL